MTTATSPYPIGTPGIPWGEAERAQWLSRQVRHRSYQNDVLSVIERLSTRFDVAEYGRLNREFHLGAYAAQSFARLQTMIGSLWDSTDWCRRIFSTDTESLRSSSAEHELIYEALARGDGDAAAAAVRAQKQRAADWYLGRVDGAAAEPAA